MEKGTLLILSLLPVVRAETNSGSCGAYGCGGFMGMGGGSLTGWLIRLLFWILLIGIILYLARYLTRGNAGGDTERQSKSSMDILEERYARGEIGKEEYEERKKDLMG
jgi:putative membrane protein